jgi:hypothetical protein
MSNLRFEPDDVYLYKTHGHPFAYVEVIVVGPAEADRFIGHWSPFDYAHDTSWHRNVRLGKDRCIPHPSPDEAWARFVKKVLTQ